MSPWRDTSQSPGLRQNESIVWYGLEQRSPAFLTVRAPLEFWNLVVGAAIKWALLEVLAITPRKPKCIGGKGTLNKYSTKEE